MYFATSTLLLSLAATTLAWPFARPQDATALAAAASKKNVYLSTCSTRGLLGFFDRDSTSTVIYYNGPSAGRSPSDAAVVSEPARNWEGEQRRVRTVAGQFISSITEGAQDYPKNAISGTAKIGDEDMVCFKDGDSVFQFREGLLGLQKTTCQAEYWCASIDL